MACLTEILLDMPEAVSRQLKNQKSNSKSFTPNQAPHAQEISLFFVEILPGTRESLPMTRLSRYYRNTNDNVQFGQSVLTNTVQILHI